MLRYALPILLKSQLIQPYWKIYNNEGSYGLGNKISMLLVKHTMETATEIVTHELRDSTILFIGISLIEIDR